jgi:tetratricopeptide (TPR) repeat protein
MRFYFIFLFVACSFYSTAIELDEVLVLDHEINEYDNNGLSALVLVNADKLFRLASNLSSDSLKTLYKCRALMFKMDRYKINNPTLFESTFLLFKEEYNISKYKSFYLNYCNLYYSSVYLKNSGHYRDILKTIEENEKYIISQKEALSLKEYSSYMMKIYAQKGDYYLAENNFLNALNQFEKALVLASINDSENKKDAKEKNKYWGFRKAQLINLFKVGVISNNETITQKYAELLRLDKRKSLYDKFWNRELVESILKSKDIKPDQIKNILVQMDSNELLSHDANIYISISRYFLESGLMNEALRFKNKALYLLPSYAADPLVDIHFNLLLAEIALKQCRFDLMNTFILKSKMQFMDSTGQAPIPLIKGSRKEYLSFMQNATSFYLQAYEYTNEKLYLEQCAHLTDEAIHTLIALRIGLPGESDRTTLLTQLIDLCNNALTNYFELSKFQHLSKGNMDALINYIEADKSFNLLCNKELLSREQQSELFILNSMISPGFQKTEQATEDLDSVSLLQENSYDKILKIYNSALQGSHFDPTISLEQVQTKLQDNSSVIEFFSTQESVFALVINRSDQKFVKLPKFPLGGPGLNELIITFGVLIDGTKISNIPFHDYSQISYRLFEYLIKPLLPYIKNKVIIIPEANMSTLPWGALLTDSVANKVCTKWPYWIRTQIISTQHSLALWLRDYKKVNEISHHAETNLSAFAPHFSNLTENRTECEDLVHLIGGKLFSGREANFKNFSFQGKASKIIHIASHAKANVDYQDSSFVMLDSMKLYSGQLGENSYPADLIFLSACETGIGKVIKSEGVMSFARAFFNAGAKSVISTLWQINDNSTSRQVLNIYENLTKGQSKDEAIRSMQLKYLEDAKTSEAAFPYYWAAYQCQGDLSPIFKKKSFIPVFALLPILSFGLLGLFAFIFPGLLGKSKFKV